MSRVTVSRFLLVVLYIGYLVNVGLLMILLPWSDIWGLLLTQFPTPVRTALDSPWVRGAISAFGILHLLLVAWELIHPTLLPVTRGSDTARGS